MSLKASSDTADIPVILVSAQVGVADRVRALNLGAVDYLAKPFHASELLQARRPGPWRRSRAGAEAGEPEPPASGHRRDAGDRAARPPGSGGPADPGGGPGPALWPAALAGGGPDRRGPPRAAPNGGRPDAGAAPPARTCSPTSARHLRRAAARVHLGAGAGRCSAGWSRISSAVHHLHCTVEVAEVPGRELPEAVLEHLLEGRPCDVAAGWRHPSGGPLGSGGGRGPGRPGPRLARPPRCVASHPRVDVSAMREAMEAPERGYSVGLRLRPLPPGPPASRCRGSTRRAWSSCAWRWPRIPVAPSFSSPSPRPRRAPVRPRGAEATVRALLERHPDHVPALLFLGRLLFETDRPDRAREVLARARQLAPASRSRTSLWRRSRSRPDARTRRSARCRNSPTPDRDTTGLKRLGLRSSTAVSR